MVKNLPANARDIRQQVRSLGWDNPLVSSRAEGLLFLHGLESNPGSSLQTEEEDS